MVTSEKHQKSLLGGIERLVGISHPDLLPQIPKILMALYQADIIEEDVVTQWGTHVSKKYVDKETSKKVRKASEPFLKVRVIEMPQYLTKHKNSGLKRPMMMMMSKRVLIYALLCPHKYITFNIQSVRTSRTQLGKVS